MIAVEHAIAARHLEAGQGQEVVVRVRLAIRDQRLPLGLRQALAVVGDDDRIQAAAQRGRLDVGHGARAIGARGVHVPVVVDEERRLPCGSRLAETRQNGNDHEGERRHQGQPENIRNSSLRIHSFLLPIR